MTHIPPIHNEELTLLRDHFAGAALTGIMASFPDSLYSDCACWAYNMAEVMLAEREKRMEAKP